MVSPSPLLEKIHHTLGQQESIPFSQFMEMALYTPGLGYYVSGRTLLGEQGDFTTAPEISPLFGYSLAQAIYQQPRNSDWSLLEFGAGSGKLALSILEKLEQLQALPSTYYILEVSPSLAHQQKTLLKAQLPQLQGRIVWLDRLPVEFQGVIVANEVLDAMPTTVIEVEDGRVQEKQVGHSGPKQFTWKNQPASQAINSHIESLKLTPSLHTYPNDYQTEVNLLHKPWLRSLSAAIDNAHVFLIDYGYSSEQYYHPARNRGTLRCCYQHRAHDNPFVHVGEQDLTTHVNFSHVMQAACDSGFEVIDYQTQAQFLINNGLIEHLTELHTISDSKAQRLHNQALQTLTDPQQMGELFKVLHLSKQDQSSCG